jgi:DNA-directed RNA polymerase specialized sigma subunit
MQLKQYQRIMMIDRYIALKLIIEELEEKYAAAVSPKITAVNSGEIMGSSAPDKVGDTVCRIIDVSKKLRNAINEQRDLKEMIIISISKLKDKRARQIMTMRYIDEKPWHEIYKHMSKEYGMKRGEVAKLNRNSKKYLQ